MRVRTTAATLLEVVVALGLLAMLLPLLLNLLPSAMLSARRAERLQVGTTLITYRMDEVPLLDYKPGLDLDEVVQIDSHRYRLCREFYAVDTYRMDVAVSCVLLDSDLEPIRLGLRVPRLDGQ